MSLTAAEIVDARRYCGYPMSAAMSVYPDAEVRANSDMLNAILAALSTAEEAVVRNVYLLKLRDMEQGIADAAANLDTAKAAVWTHNPNELAERQALYYAWRIQFANFLGVPPGPGVYAPTTNAGGVSALVPAAYAV